MRPETHDDRVNVQYEWRVRGGEANFAPNKKK